MKANLFLLLVALSVLSCGKDNDNNPEDIEIPVLESVVLNNSAGILHLSQQDTLRAEMFFSDNEELASAKVEIHGDADDHHHTSKLTAAEFTYSKVFELEGKTSSLDLNVVIPKDAEPGEYHFTVRAIDAAGNESVLRVERFVVEEAL